MSTISQPNSKGISQIHFGGNYVGEIKKEGDVYSGTTFNGKHLVSKTLPKNLAVKALVKYYRKLNPEVKINLEVTE